MQRKAILSVVHLFQKNSENLKHDFLKNEILALLSMSLDYSAIQ